MFENRHRFLLHMSQASTYSENTVLVAQMIYGVMATWAHGSLTDLTQTSVTVLKCVQVI